MTFTIRVMVNLPDRSRLTGLVLASLLVTLAACGGGGSSEVDGGVDAGVAQCGDGQKHPDEACDDGNTIAGDGCSAFCTQVEPGWTCAEQGKPCYRTPTCGNGIVETTESCDDLNKTAGDGCSASCVQENGWRCPLSGGRCRAAQCGDHVIAGDEECEDGNTAPGDGCSATCHLEPGYKCEQVDQPCAHTICGDKIVEGTEQCDDQNNNLGDGCTPLCTREPKCSNGTCEAVCGDGVMLPGDTSEECDDGNTRANDGCSPTCKVEPGFKCDNIEQVPPSTVEIPVVYRDFIPFTQTGGHIDFENKNAGDETGIVRDTLGTNGKPVYAKEGVSSANTNGKASFDQWYVDSSVNRTVVQTLSLKRQTDGSYVSDNPSFFPLDAAGWVAEGKETPQKDLNGADHNFGFTSEARYWFQFQATEKLAFRGDDDVWVFINGKLAVDLGGVHSARDGSIDLSMSANATRLGLVKDRIYEAVVFQAERHTKSSSYKLTLTNFTTRRSKCDSTCGNGKVDSGEECDDPNGNPGGYGKCAPGCIWSPRCGDGHVDTDYGEECDDRGPTRTCSDACKGIIG